MHTFIDEDAMKWLKRALNELDSSTISWASSAKFHAHCTIQGAAQAGDKKKLGASVLKCARVRLDGQTILKHGNRHPNISTSTLKVAQHAHPDGIPECQQQAETVQLKKKAGRSSSSSRAP